MAYRSEEEATRARRADLERELGEVRARSEAYAYLAWRCREIEAAIAELDARTGELAAKKRLPLLARAKIATPCTADWDGMVGDDHVRFCSSCEKNVYDLSALTSADAEALLRAKEGNLCAIYYVRSDDTILTSDCAVGIRQKWFKRAGTAAVVVGGAVAGMTAAMATLMHRSEDEPIAPAVAEVCRALPPTADVPTTPTEGVLNPQTFADVPRPPTPVAGSPRVTIHRVMGMMSRHEP